MAYTVIVSAIAVAVSLAVVNLLQARRRRRPRRRRRRCSQQSAGRAGEIVKAGAEQPSGIDAFVNIIPNNLVEVMGSNSAILSVMFFALFFGIGLLLTDTPNSRALQRGFEGLFDVTMRLILIVIKLAPIAVACFMFNLAALFGWDLLIRLSAYVGVVLLALGDPDVHRLTRSLLATLGQEEPDRLLPRDPGSQPDGLLDRLVQRDPADLAAGRRREARSCRGGCRASS